MRNELIVGFESALGYWRAARAADYNPSLDSCGPSHSDVLLELGERAKRAAEECLVETPLDVVVASPSERHCCELVRDHVWAGEVDLAATEYVSGAGLVCDPCTTFVQLGRELDVVDLARVAHELVGTYVLMPWSDEGCRADVDQLTNLEELGHSAQRAAEAGVRGARRALEALAVTTENSNSPLETDIAILLKTSRAKGGFGLGGFEMNPKVRLSLEGQLIMGRTDIRPDFAWPGTDLVLEYDSDRWHTTPEAHERDSRRRAAYIASGRTPLDLTHGMLHDYEALCSLMDELERRLGIVRSPINASMAAKRERLLERVLGMDSKGRGVPYCA